MIRIPIHKSIRFKLFVFTSLLIACLLSTTAFLDGSFLFRQLMLTKQEQTGIESRMMANQLESVLDGWVSQMLMVTNGLAFSKKESHEAIVRAYTKSNTDIVGFYLVQEKVGKDEGFELSVLSADKMDNRFVGANPDAIHQATVKRLKTAVRSLNKSKTKLEFTNLAPIVGAPIFAVGMSFNVEGSKERVWAFVTTWQTRMFSALTDSETGFVVLLDKKMNVLTSNSLKTLNSPKNIQFQNEIDEMSQIKVNSGLKEWKHNENDLSFGTWSDLKRYNLRLYSITSGKPIYMALTQIIERSAYLALFVTLVSIMIVYYVAGKTTQSLNVLMSGALEIAKGNFKNKVQINSNDEVGVLGRIVNYMSVELENFVQTRAEKVRLESSLETAKIVQKSYIPTVDSLPETFNLSAFYQPADACGGDWWGHFPVNKDLHLFAIADATGHGIPAALITAMIFSMTSLAAQDLKDKKIENISPADMLSKFNKALSSHGNSRHTLTYFVAVVDSARGIMKFASAGHNPPLYYSATQNDGGQVDYVRKPLKASGNPLGLINDSHYIDNTQVLNHKDRILLFTDGLIECTNQDGTPWGKNSLQKLLKYRIADDAPEVVDQIVKDSFKHFDGHPLVDDITLVVINYLGKSGVQQAAKKKTA
jgi:serine phosphatase RsbU (regulator of sigma subunit)